jgi:uncharacterized protein (UPF0335 family)
MGTVIGNIDAGHLESFINRIERLDEEKTAIATDIKEVYAEAKSMGYDVKTMKQIVALRKQNPADREENEFLLDVYKRALNLVSKNNKDEADE